jgi:hypothetical protein
MRVFRSGCNAVGCSRSPRAAQPPPAACCAADGRGLQQKRTAAAQGRAISRSLSAQVLGYSGTACCWSGGVRVAAAAAAFFVADPPLPPFRYVAGEYKKYNNNWDWAEDKRCFPTLTISSHNLSSHLHAPPNTSLPQQHASSFQPLDPDLLSRQAAHMRHSSAFSSSITCADCCRFWFCFVTVFTLCRV